MQAVILYACVCVLYHCALPSSLLCFMLRVSFKNTCHDVAGGVVVKQLYTLLPCLTTVVPEKTRIFELDSIVSHGSLYSYVYSELFSSGHTNTSFYVTYYPPPLFTVVLVHFSVLLIVYTCVFIFIPMTALIQ